jgi:hypothetical protein
MTNKQFVALAGFVIVLLLGGMALEPYRTCQENGGIYCKPGPGTMGSRMSAPRQEAMSNDKGTDLRSRLSARNFESQTMEPAFFIRLNRRVVVAEKEMPPGR